MWVGAGGGGGRRGFILLAFTFFLFHFVCRLFYHCHCFFPIWCLGQDVVNVCVGLLI